MWDEVMHHLVLWDDIKCLWLIVHLLFVYKAKTSPLFKVDIVLVEAQYHSNIIVIVLNAI